jgi:hypothetical protein
MKRISLYLICFFSLVGLTEIKSQNAFKFTEGLICGPCHQYGREAIYTDQFAYRFYSENRTPLAGQVLFTDDKGKDIAWKVTKADTAGRLSDTTVYNGYIYLTYKSDVNQSALLHVTSNSMVFFNGEPHAGDIYESKWLYIPVNLKKGLNELYVRTARFADEGVRAELIFPKKPVFLSAEDLTLPSIVDGEDNKALWGALVIINASDKTLSSMEIKTQTQGKGFTTLVPAIPPMTTRKIGFQIDASGIKQKAQYPCEVTLTQKGKTIDQKTIKIDAVSPKDYYSGTFISEIDGSVQYYGVCPRSQEDGTSPALFLSVHGAGVEAIGQARAYQPKSWGVLVAPTNRRPRGFNWEDWGRLDALEVFNIAVKKFNPDPQRIYLTGHSMGGHGTWYLGATFPGKWAAIAPCAGYPTLVGYGSADGKIPATGQNDVEKTLLRASNGSNVFELAPNYGAGGVYIHHGDSDKVVSVEYARQMRKVLATFHKDFSYHEFPGGSHWFGSQSVDWPPLFEYFKWHTINPDSVVNHIDFTTANPAVSSSCYWASVLQQQEALKYSRIRLGRDHKTKSVSGETENVSILGISFPGSKPGDTLRLNIDHQAINYMATTASPTIYLYHKGQWQLGEQPETGQKGIIRNGTFKEPFNNRMIFVYGTTGNQQENSWSYNKARFDAETWYYRGNGAVDMIADKDFNPSAFPDRGIIIYGNANTNSAWNKLLSRCPIQVKRGSIAFGNKQLKGDDLGAYIMWPRADSKKASIAAITGTGLKGLEGANANQYFAGGSGFPDYMIFSLDMLKDGSKGIKYAGFYGNDWNLTE